MRQNLVSGEFPKTFGTARGSLPGTAVYPENDALDPDAFVRNGPILQTVFRRLENDPRN
jgi:hypothetical protein